jgi:hypothetical protein
MKETKRWYYYVLHNEGWVKQAFVTVEAARYARNAAIMARWVVGEIYSEKKEANA